MALKLKAMTSDDLVAFLRDCIPYYAGMMLDVGEYPDYDAAYSQAYHEIMAYFSNGQVPSTELLYNMVEPDSGETVGSLWLSMITREEQPLIFISYITVNEGYRRRGYAASALAVAEKMLLPHGFEKYELYVFVNNVGAVQLYQRLGYEIVDKKITR